jgi:ABC-type transporter Mla MlaB component
MGLSAQPEPTVVVGTRLTPGDVLDLWDIAGPLLDAAPGRSLVCDVTALTVVDCGTIDALARMALRARRHGSRVHLRNASRELRELLALCGLAAVVPCVDYLVVETLGKPEEREELLRVEEERDPANRTI